jgi:hypothetical protein
MLVKGCSPCFLLYLHIHHNYSTDLSKNQINMKCQMHWHVQVHCTLLWDLLWMLLVLVSSIISFTD